MMLNLDAERFDTDREELCPALRWKGQFIATESDPTVPPPTTAFSGACTPKPVSVPTASWPSREIARQNSGRAMAQENADEQGRGSPLNRTAKPTLQSCKGSSG